MVYQPYTKKNLLKASLNKTGSTLPHTSNGIWTLVQVDLYQGVHINELVVSKLSYGRNSLSIQNES